LREFLATLSLGTWLLIAWVLWAVVAVIGILAQRRSPVSTLAWMLALLLMPYLGGVIYLFFGPRRLQRRLLHRAGATDRVAEAAVEHLRATRSDAAFTGRGMQRQLMRMLDKAGEGRAARASRVEVINDGDECHGAILGAVEAARDHVHIEYYIWEPGTCGEELRDALVRKAAQGVEVRVLVDHVGSSQLPGDFWARLQQVGGETAVFNELRITRFNPQLLNFRTHRKLVVCDGRVGLTGGMNISDRHSRRLSGAEAWRDTHLAIEGEPVRKLQRVFLEDWLFAHPADRERDFFNARYFPRLAAQDGPWLQIVADGPDDVEDPIHRGYFGAMTGATRRVWLTTPYFIPDEAILTALTTAALRGVDVQLLVPKQGDSKLVTAAARTYYDDLVKAGAHVHEYGPPMLHAKTLVVDDDVAIVGTANVDNRSFRLNFELIVVAYDRTITATLARQFEQDLRLSAPFQRPTREHLKRLGPLADRFVDSLARLFSPIL